MSTALTIDDWSDLAEPLYYADSCISCELEGEWVSIPGENPFRIMTNPVTVRDFRKLMPDDFYGGEFGKLEQPEHWKLQLEYSDRPVVYLNWFSAVAYAEWMRGQLPTEAQLERAALHGVEIITTIGEFCQDRFEMVKSDPADPFASYNRVVRCGIERYGLYPWDTSAKVTFRLVRRI